MDETEPSNEEQPAPPPLQDPAPPPLPEVLPPGASLDRIPELGSASKAGLFLCAGGLLGVLLWLGEGWSTLSPFARGAGIVEVCYAAMLGVGIYRIRALPLMERKFNRAMIPVAVQAGLLFLAAGLLTLGTRGVGIGLVGGLLTAVLFFARFLGPIFAILASLRGRRTAALWVAEGLGFPALATIGIVIG